MNYTNEQLKRTLAKMLPEKIHWYHRGDGVWDLCWIVSRPFQTTTPVLDTELLHLCWLAEETLKEREMNDYFTLFGHNCWNMTHATWQQRTIALAQTLRIEIV